MNLRALLGQPGVQPRRRGAIASPHLLEHPIVGAVLEPQRGEDAVEFWHVHDLSAGGGRSTAKLRDGGPCRRVVADAMLGGLHSVDGAATPHLELSAPAAFAFDHHRVAAQDERCEEQRATQEACRRALGVGCPAGAAWPWRTDYGPSRACSTTARPTGAGARPPSGSRCRSKCATTWTTSSCCESAVTSSSDASAGARK